MEDQISLNDNHEIVDREMWLVLFCNKKTGFRSRLVETEFEAIGCAVHFDFMGIEKTMRRVYKSTIDAENYVKGHCYVTAKFIYNKSSKVDIETHLQAFSSIESVINHAKHLLKKNRISKIKCVLDAGDFVVTNRDLSTSPEYVCEMGKGTDALKEYIFSYGTRLRLEVSGYGWRDGIDGGYEGDEYVKSFSDAIEKAASDIGDECTISVKDQYGQFIAKIQ